MKYWFRYAYRGLALVTALLLPWTGACLAEAGSEALPAEAIAQELAEAEAAEAWELPEEATPQEFDRRAPQEDPEPEPTPEPDPAADFVIEDGVLRSYVGTSAEVYIPGEVREIGSGAFAGNITLTSVILPEGVLAIDGGAFSDCPHLANVTLPETLQRLVSPFVLCPQLENLELPKNLERYEIDETLEERPFAGCPQLMLRVHADSYGQQLCEQYSLPFALISAGTIPVEKVTLPTQLINLAVGGSYRLEATVSPAYATCCDLLWSSESPEIASVEGGVVRGLAVGATLIHVRAADGTGRSAYCVVCVVPAMQPTGLQLNRSELSLGVGDRFQLAVGRFEPEGAVAPVQYSSNKRGVVAVEADSGWLSAKKAGTATITASIDENIQATCKVTVKAAPKAGTVALTADMSTLSVGQVAQLSVQLPKKTEATHKLEVINGTECVTLLDHSAVALAEGRATVRATTHNGVTAELTLTVLPAPTEILWDIQSITLGVDEEFTLKPRVDVGQTNFHIDSDAPEVAKVEGKKLCAVKEGQATVHIRSHNGLQRDMQVTVKSTPKKLTLPLKKLTLPANATWSCAVEFSEGSASYSLALRSSKPKVASVKAGANPGEILVTALKKGSTTITVQTYNGKTASLYVTVE